MLSTDYDWATYEPEKQGLEYLNVETSVSVVLSPVKGWSGKLRLEIDADMAKSGTMYTWERFMGESPFFEGTTLIRQAADLAVFGVPHIDAAKHFPKSPYDYGDDREIPFMIMSHNLVSRALDWLWYTFSCRLENQAESVAVNEGMAGLTIFCDSITSRFDVRSQWTPELSGAITPDEVERARRGEKLSPEAFAARMEQIGRVQSHELWPVIDRAAIKGHFPGDWNGWEQEAWLRFVGSVDRARQKYAALATAVDDRPHAGQARTPPGSQPERAAEPLTTGIGGYHASDYADRVFRTFESNPSKYLIRARFRPLMRDAGLSQRQERTLKERIGYTGDAATGFTDFLRLLYARAGRVAPEALHSA